MSDTTAHLTGRKRAMVRAADAARFAPSLHNTQPWRWVVRLDQLDLFAVQDRRLPGPDPEGHLLLLGCGAALHHARIALADEGWQYEVDRPADSPLATIHPTHRAPVDDADTRHFRMLHVRHTDRHTVADVPVAPATLDLLVRATEEAGGRLHLLRRDQLVDLAVAVEHAERAGAADGRRRAEQAAWAGGERPAGTGVPAGAIPDEPPPTTVAERDFGAPGTLAAGPGHDAAATYAVLYGSDDRPADWLRAGEALSALWLTAAEHAVSLVPVSSPVEVPHTRHELARLIGGVGVPYLAVRLGVPDAGSAEAARTPRLGPDQVIEIID